MPSERIQLLIDVVTGNSKSTLGKLKTDLAAADGATGKLKAGAGALGTALKQNAALGATAAATAIAGFAVKAVGDFQDIALGAGELRDSLGVTAEEASRLQEVGKDLGIPVDALEASLGKMNRAAADTPEAFDNIGASIARNADGTTDVNQTFLNTIDALNRIPDATQRAAAAQKIFGRGWMQISELVGMSADEVTGKLEAVGDAKIAGDEQIAQAREFRDNLEDLKDSVSSVSENVGGELVPVLNDLIGVFQRLGDAVESIPGEDFAKTVFSWVNPTSLAFKGLGKLNDVLEDITGTTHGSVGAMASLGEGMTDTERQVSQFEAAEARATEAAKELYSSTEEGARNVELMGEAAERAEEQARGHAEGLLAEADAATAMATAARAAADAGFALEQAQRESKAAGREVHEATLDLVDAQKEYGDIVADEESTQADRERGMLAVADAMDRVAEAEDKVVESAAAEADAQVRLRDERAKARGEVMSATESLGTFNRSLLDQAAAAEGPARKSIVDYLVEVNKIPPKKASRIEALIDQGKINRAKSLLDDTSRTRTATVTADANTAAAKNELDQLDNPRTMTITPLIGKAVHSQHGRQVGNEGVLSIVGEAGPELVALPPQSRVFSNPQSARMLGVQSFQHGGTVRATSRVRNTLGRAESAAAAANALEAQIKALRELADATEDADEKEKILEKQSKLLEERERLLTRATNLAESAADRHAKSVNRERAELEAEINVLRKHAEGLRNQADAARDAAAARAEGLAEQATSLREAFDAAQTLEDAQLGIRDNEQALADARKAQAAANRQQTIDGVTTFVHSAEERAAAARAVEDAVRAEEDAVVALADAEVQEARERAEARGKTFTELDEIAVMRKALLAQGRGDLVRDLGLSQAAQLARQAIAVQAAADKRADKLESAADKDEASANKLEKAANAMDRFANKLPNAIARAFARANKQNLTEEELTRLINRILAGS